MISNRLTKFATGVGTTLTMWYWLAAPAFAIDLCPTNTLGVAVPGCDGVDLGKLTGSVIGILLFVAFLIALIFLIIGGIRWILSGGDKEATNKAKDTVTSALIGLVVVLSAFVLINVVLQLILGTTLDGLFKGGSGKLMVK